MCNICVSGYRYLPIVVARLWMRFLYQCFQAMSDIERGWVVASKEQQKQLSLLRQRGSKKEVRIVNT